LKERVPLKIIIVPVKYALLLVIASSPVFAFVMGEDNRVPVTASDMRIPGVAQTGMILIGEKEFVTGLVMGRNCDVVVSAGHAAIHSTNVARKGWEKGKLRADGRFKFALHPGGPTMNMTLVASGFQVLSQIDNDAHDWSIFRLRDAGAPSCPSLRYEGGAVACTGRISMPGFHFDRRQRRLIDKSCSIRDIIDGVVMVHDCDTKDGSSGAPLLCHEGRSTRILGINISGVTAKDDVEPGVYGQHGRRFHYRNRVNYAVSIHGEFRDALAEELQASRVRAAKDARP